MTHLGADIGSPASGKRGRHGLKWRQGAVRVHRGRKSVEAAVPMQVVLDSSLAWAFWTLLFEVSTAQLAQAVDAVGSTVFVIDAFLRARRHASIGRRSRSVHIRAIGDVS